MNVRDVSDGTDPVWRGPAWARPGAPLFASYIATLAAVVRRPARFFDTLPLVAPVPVPSGFALIGMTVGGLAWYIYSLLLPMTSAQFLFVYVASLWAPQVSAQANGAQMDSMGHLLNLVFIPFYALLSLFLHAGISQFLLFLIGRNRVRYDGTLRVHAYTNGSLYWLLFIPFLGDSILFFWTMALYVIGLDRIHRCGLGWAGFVVLAPIVLAFLLAWGLA